VRALLATPEITAFPGQPFFLNLDVSNTADVIDSVLVSVDGLDGATVTTVPSELALFPGASGSLAVSVLLPKGFRAGRYQAEVSAASRLAPTEVASCRFSLDVEPVTRATLAVVPLTKTGRRQSRFIVEVENLGNTFLVVGLEASDTERQLRLHFRYPRVSVNPGSSGKVHLDVQAPRKLFGSEKSRQINIVGDAVPTSDGTTLPSLALETRATYVQKPRVPRGVMTALILMAVVGLWAAIFTFGLSEVLSQQTLTKAAPLSFFAPLPSAAAPGAGGANGSKGAQAVGSGASGAAAATPAGFQPKDIAPAGIGGTISGKVTSRFEADGVGRVTVEAFLVGAKYPIETSAATGPDGTFQIVGLFPGSYKVELTAPGYRSVWYPGTPSEASAVPVLVAAGATPPPLSLIIAGEPGSITGKVLTGEPTSPPVSVTALVNNVPVGAQVTSNSKGQYTLKGLATPATYTLSFLAHGFQQYEQQVFVDGDQSVVANAVQLSAGTGEIDGLVASTGVPVPAVTVMATANGNTFTSATASSGPVGEFRLPLLPTPATYLLTFTAAGFGTQTVAVDLAPGQHITRLRVGLVGGTGTISGLVKSSSGTGLGGVTVTVGGLATPASTQTLTGGGDGSQKGFYTLADLPTPGDYAVTFSAPGYASQTLGVKLRSGTGAKALDVTLAQTIGWLQGTVTDAKTKAGLPGVNVAITNGVNQEQTTTASSPDGGYKLTQLPGGVYTVTYSLVGYSSETVIVNLQPGQKATHDIGLQPQTAAATTTTAAGASVPAPPAATTTSVAGATVAGPERAQVPLVGGPLPRASR
jgi:hypothetical protein